MDIFNFPGDYKYSMVVLAYRYLLQYRHHYFKSPTIPKIEKKIEDLFTNLLKSNENKEIILELVDIMIEHNNPKGIEMLNIIRRHENEIARKEARRVALEARHQQQILRYRNRLLEKTRPNIRTVYEDTQNVHNSVVNENVKKVAVNINKKALEYGSLPNWVSVKKQILELFGSSTKLNKVLDRIKRDNATYGIGLNLETIFLSIWVWINKHKDVDELLIRLYQEFLEMSGYCSTGHLSRLINVIQGFTDDEELAIRISQVDRCKSVVKHYLNKILGEDEKMALQMLDKTDEFQNFIREKISIKNVEWEKENDKNFIREVREVVNNYTDCEIY